MSRLGRAQPIARGNGQDATQRILLAGGATTHDTTGSLIGAGSEIAGSAAHLVLHATTGVLTGPGSEVIGAAARTRAHPTSGALIGAGSEIVGSADHAVPGGTHATTGALIGPGSEIAGSAARLALHATTGALVGPGSEISGSAAHLVLHATTGALTGPGSEISGSAARIAGAVTHATSGVLIGPGSLISGAAAAPFVATVGGGGGYFPNVRRQTRKDIHAERVRLGILPADVVAAAQVVALEAAKDGEPVEVYKDEKPRLHKMFLRELGATKMLPDYTRAIQIQIELMQQEEDDILMFM